VADPRSTRATPLRTRLSETTPSPPPPPPTHPGEIIRPGSYGAKHTPTTHTLRYVREIYTSLLITATCRGHIHSFSSSNTSGWATIASRSRDGQTEITLFP